MTNLTESPLALNRASPAARRRCTSSMVDEELPYPPTSGKRIRTLNLTLRLAERHRVTYVCHRNADADEAARPRTHFARARHRAPSSSSAPCRRSPGRGSTPGWPPTCCRRCRTRSPSHASPALRRGRRGMRADAAGRPVALRVDALRPGAARRSPGRARWSWPTTSSRSSGSATTRRRRTR